MSLFFQVDPAGAIEFFDSVLNRYRTKASTSGPAAIVIAHALGSGEPFLKTIDKLCSKVVFVPKASSCDDEVLEKLRSWGWNVFRDYTSTDLADSITVANEWIDLLPAQEDLPLLVFDVGGKLADGDTTVLKTLLEHRQVLVVEDTENGHQKYARLLEQWEKAGCRHRERLQVWSVARSILKEPEDYWTGRGIVEATETILRIHYGLMGDGPAIVFGFGKIGRSIAYALREKRLAVSVVELDPIRAVQAQCEGFRLCSKDDAQRLGGYVFFATGGERLNSGVTADDLLGFQRESIFTFATSHDDEIKDFLSAFDSARGRPVQENVTLESMVEKFDKPSNEFSTKARLRNSLVKALHVYDGKPPANARLNLVNLGSPPNFLFEASCGPYIYLVQAGLLAAAAKAISNEAWNSGGIFRLGNSRESDGRERDEDEIYALWQSRFTPQISSSE